MQSEKLASSNYYNILEIPSNASSEEIKKAYRSKALKCHPDKKGDEELMKKISEAYHTLADVERRRDYDSNRDYSNDTSFCSAGNLHVGAKWSDDFKAKIDFWKKVGCEESNIKVFIDPNNVSVDEMEAEYVDSATFSFRSMMIHDSPHGWRNFTSKKKGLGAIIPEHILNWSHTMIQFIKGSIIHSQVWNEDLLAKKEPAHYRTKYNKLAVSVKKLFEAKGKEITFPDVRHLEQEVNQFLYSSSAASVFHTDNRHPNKTTISLCPTGLQSEIGSKLPTHTVGPQNLVLDTNRSKCEGCNEDFNIFRWKSNCMVCGTCYCHDCLADRKVPDYEKPVHVCNDCVPELKKTYQNAWVSVVEHIVTGQLITPKYLALIDVLGFADRSTFMRWVDKFVDNQNFDLALQCNISGNGNWFDLAAKFIEREQYDYAKTCLNQIKNKDSQWWSSQGDKNSAANYKLALMCYQKAQLNRFDYLHKALENSDTALGAACLLAGMQLAKNKGQKIQVFNDTFDGAMAEKKYALAIAALILGNVKVDKWIDIINDTGDIVWAESLVQAMDDTFKCDWYKVEFVPEKDHLRWRFLGTKNFDVWLGYLENLLQKLDDHNHRYCIAYFRSEMRNENFIAHRDAYLAKQAYTKALLCHCLIPNRISWQDLQKRWRSKDENASLACCYYSMQGKPNDWLDIGNQLYNQGDFSLALHSYLQGGYQDEIVLKAKTADFSTRLLYYFELLLKSDRYDVVLDLCKTLMEVPENSKEVRSVLISNLNQKKGTETLPYYQLIAQTGISDLELLGLLKEAQLLCTSKKDTEWYQGTLAKITDKLKITLHKAVLGPSLKDVMPMLDLIHPLTVPAVREVFKQVKMNTLPKGPNLSICLIIRAMIRINDPKFFDILKAMNDVTEALLGDPSEENMPYFSKIIEKISNRFVKLRGKELTNLQQAQKSEFIERLNSKNNPVLKMLIRSEGAIAEFAPLDAAMSYIDLCMAIPFAAGLAGGFLTAASELLKTQKKELELSRYKPNDIYAYRKAIVELVTIAYSFGNSHLCPSTQIYVLRSAIAILTSTFQNFISSSEQSLVDELYNEMDKLSAVTPMVLDRMITIYDLIFLDLINNKMNLAYLLSRCNSPSVIKNPKYQYYLFEGTWKGWVDEEKFKFAEERERAMQDLLDYKGNTWEDVEALMNYPLVERDADGWLPIKPTHLRLQGSTFSRVVGIRFKMDTGEIDLLLESTDKPEEALFDWEDVNTVMNQGVTGAFYSLEQPDPSLEYHPFQNEIFGPDCIAGTKFLDTLRQTDMRMKELSMSTEVSSKIPFPLRDAEEGLFKRLPPDLSKKFKEVRDNISRTQRKVNRFWIEAGELKYYPKKWQNTVTYTFSDCTMSVKKRLMKRDSEGNLKDVEDDTENDSAEAKFADLMTKEFKMLGKYFPEFARLEELVKLQAMSWIAQNIYQAQKEGSESLDIPIDQIYSKLDSIREQVTYPASDEIESMITDCLKQNQVSRWEVSEWQLDDLRKKLLGQCSELDEKTETQISDILSESFHADKYEVSSAVWRWLNCQSQSRANLALLLKQSETMHAQARILRICETFDRAGIATKPQSDMVENRSTWLPAAFRKSDNRRVYGGVLLGGKVSSGGPGGYGWGANAPPPGGGGPIGPGASGTGYRHVVSLHGDGRITGTTTCVDRVTGNVYQNVIKHTTCIRDQFNQNNATPDVSYGMKSKILYPDVLRYSQCCSST